MTNEFDPQIFEEHKNMYGMDHETKIDILQDQINTQTKIIIGISVVIAIILFILIYVK